MKLTKKIFALLALVFALVAVTACSSNSSSGKSTAKARTIEEIKKSGELRIAVFADKKPFGYGNNIARALTKVTILNLVTVWPKTWVLNRNTGL